MIMQFDLRRRLALLLVVGILMPGLAGCERIIESETKPVTTARVIVGGTSPVPLLLVTSTNYLAFRNTETGAITVQLTTADTATISLPFDKSYPFAGADRFFVKLINPDINATASIRLQLLVDAKAVFDQSATMRDASLEYTFFNFNF